MASCDRFLYYCILTVIFLHHPFQNRTIPSSRTTTLASLVKGRWIDGKAQTVALLLSACDMPAPFILQTFLPSRRKDCRIEPCHSHNPLKSTAALAPEPTLPKPHYPSKSTIAFLAYERSVGFASHCLVSH